MLNYQTYLKAEKKKTVWNLIMFPLGKWKTSHKDKVERSAKTIGKLFYAHANLICDRSTLKIDRKIHISNFRFLC